MGYLDLSKQELEKEYGNLVKRFEEIKGMGLNLNMARGKPSKEQLDLLFIHRFFPLFDYTCCSLCHPVTCMHTYN